MVDSNNHLKQIRDLYYVAQQPCPPGNCGKELAKLVEELDNHLSNLGDFPTEWVALERKIERFKK